MTSKLARWSLAACHAENFLRLFLEHPEIAKKLDRSEVLQALEGLSQSRIEMLADCGGTQPADGEPVAYIPAATMARLKPGMAVPATLFAPPIPEEHYGVPVFLAPPAAAHGDEAVQYRLLRVGEVIKATDELLMDDCTTWHPMGDGPQIGIGWGWHAGLMPVRRIDAAMRAQGDGEPS